MNKIKILFAVGRLSVGGGEKLLINQLRAIDASRFDPFLVTLFSEQKESLAGDVRLDSAHWLKLNFQSLFDLAAWLKLIKFLRRERFTAIVTSLFSANLIVRLAAIFAHPRILISYEHNLYPNKSRWQIFMDRWLARITNFIIVDAVKVADFTSKQESIPREKFVMLHIPPLLDERAPMDAAVVRSRIGIKNPNCKIVLTVSRLVPEKGHRYLIEAAANVLKNFPDVCFVLVGWGTLEESLKVQVERLKLEEKVFLPGRMDIQDVLPLADIYVEPAVSVDIGIALMEAMRSGKAIVATSVGEMPDFISDGANGFLVPPVNSSALSEKILVLLKDGALREKFGVAAADRVKDFSLENYMRKFEKLLAK